MTLTEEVVTLRWLLAEAHKFGTRTQLHELHHYRRASDAVDRLERTVETLTKALRPFARDAEAFDGAEGTYGEAPVFERLANGAHWQFTIADVRAARAALEASDE